jgi:glycerol-3-phosphate dehydrogenase (NAD+)
VVAVPDIVEAAAAADILIVVIPHQFIQRSLGPLKGKLKAGAMGISLVKGFEIIPGGGIRLISDSLRELLDIPVSVLMGANLAPEVADEQFCETTIGCADLKTDGLLLKALFQTPNFRVVVVQDAKTVEVGGVEFC